MVLGRPGGSSSRFPCGSHDTAAAAAWPLLLLPGVFSWADGMLGTIPSYQCLHPHLHTSPGSVLGSHTPPQRDLPRGGVGRVVLGWTSGSTLSPVAILVAPTLWWLPWYATMTIAFCHRPTLLHKSKTNSAAWVGSFRFSFWRLVIFRDSGPWTLPPLLWPSPCVPLHFVFPRSKVPSSEDASVVMCVEALLSERGLF